MYSHVPRVNSNTLVQVCQHVLDVYVAVHHMCIECAFLVLLACTGITTSMHSQCLLDCLIYFFPSEVKSSLI